MAHYVVRQWPPALESELTPRDRRGCDYRAYVPDPLTGRRITLDGEVAAAVADAEAATAALNHSATGVADTETLARLLLRAEAVASSRIEGLEVGVRRLLRAAIDRREAGAVSDVTAEEVLGNIDAMAYAIGEASAAPRFTLANLLEIHRTLMYRTRLAAEAGRLRDVQNWIGGSGYNPCGAAFVPCPPEDVLPLLLDLCEFVNEESMPAVVQAAMAHAQFETIHPFVDGNGRTGRALVHVVLRRRGLAPRVVPPVSLVLATWTDRYIAGLTATRYEGDAAPDHPGTSDWIETFAAAVARAAMDSREYQTRLAALQQAWRERLERVRAGSTVDLLLRRLPGAPIVTPRTTAELTGRSFQAANSAISVLAEREILRPLKTGRRNRVFEAPEAIAAFVNLERRLASPSGDTLVSPPVRPVPRRPG